MLTLMLNLKLQPPSFLLIWKGGLGYRVTSIVYCWGGNGVGSGVYKDNGYLKLQNGEDDRENFV